MKQKKFRNGWGITESNLKVAANVPLRSKLMREVGRYVEKAKLTQTQAAARLGVSQPRLNDLLRGKIEKFSIDSLINVLTRVGKRMSPRVRRAA